MVIPNNISCGIRVSSIGYIPSTSKNSFEGISPASQSGEVITSTSPSINSLMPAPRKDIDIINISMLVAVKKGLSGILKLNAFIA